MFQSSHIGRKVSTCQYHINGLKNNCDANSLIKLDRNMVAGDRIKIGKGPFSEFVCEIEKVSENQRIWVLIELMQQTTRTQIL